MKSELSFKNYDVTKLEFDINKNFNGEEEEISINSKISKKIINNPDNEEEFTVCLKIEIGEQSSQMPFYLNIIIEGNFELKENKELQKNAVAILYPYLRSTVSNIMSVCNIPPFFLPIINVEKWFEEADIRQGGKISTQENKWSDKGEVGESLPLFINKNANNYISNQNLIFLLKCKTAQNDVIFRIYGKIF